MPKRVVVLILLLVVIFYASFKPINASISSCSINSVSPQSLTAGDASTVVFNITNNDEASNLLHWVKIVAPSNFVITSFDGPNSGGSSISGNGSEATIMTTLSSGESGDFSVGVTTTGGVTTSGSFGIQASDTAEGDSPVSCGGDTTVSLTSGGSSAISITNVSLSVTDTSAVFTWSTSLPTTGSVQYGQSTAYGNTVNDTTLGTSHSVSISNLSASTVYHYLVSSTDQSNNTANIADRTFTTSASGETRTVTTTVTSTVTNIVREVYKDVNLPSIIIKSKISKVYTVFPKIEFSAVDDTGISRIRYSIDGGQNWSPVDIGEKIGAKKIESSFTSITSDDGDYPVLIEVTDSSGNRSFSKTLEIVIDRLPPTVGPVLVMAGPQIINTGIGGVLSLLADVEYRFVLTTSGGPNKITLNCGSNVYQFNKNIDSGVWSSEIKFDSSIEECVPVITASDGAGNVQEKIDDKILISKAGYIKNSTLTVYWFDDVENRFVVWDASIYGQENPITTNSLGKYSFMLPAGKYYIEAKSLGKRTTVSNIIKLESTSIINDSWELLPAWKFWQIAEQKIINPKSSGDTGWTKTNVNLPNFKLIDSSVNKFSTLDIRGGVSVILLSNSWHPNITNHLNLLNGLRLKGIKVYPVLLQEKGANAKYLKRRGGYEMNIYTDPDGIMLGSLNIHELPAYLIVDKYGNVVKQKLGDIKKEQEIIDAIVDL